MNGKKLTVRMMLAAFACAACVSAQAQDKKQ